MDNVKFIFTTLWPNLSDTNRFIIRQKYVFQEFKDFLGF